MDEAEAARYTALRKDIPDWLDASLWEWVRSEFVSPSTSSGSGSFSLNLVRRVERILKVTTGWDGGSAYRPDVGFSYLRAAYVSRSDVEVWRLVDFLCTEGVRRRVKPLQDLLTESGSAWMVGIRLEKVGLVQRVPDGVIDAAELIFKKGSAGKRLATAWESAFGVDPDPESAYSRAVKAVEDASIPLVTPTNPNATLGTVIGEIRRSGTFQLPYLREHATAPTHDVLLSMLQMLWTGQHDRHGGPSSVPVPNVTQDEAESAVLLAVTLVGWFETGKVQR